MNRRTVATFVLECVVVPGGIGVLAAHNLHSIRAGITLAAMMAMACAFYFLVTQGKLKLPKSFHMPDAIDGNSEDV